MNQFAFVCMLLIFISCSTETEPITFEKPERLNGTFERIKNISSDYISTPNIDVWLPPGYEKSGSTHYPVLYTHDGQFLFRDEGEQPRMPIWELDKTVTSLIESGTIEPIIIVAIWKQEPRNNYFFPEKALNLLDDATKQSVINQYGRLLSDEYLSFIVKELKPYIDKTYHTKPEKEHTAILGASAGGLISLYAISEYPEVFGSAACMSSAWPALDNLAARYFSNHLPDPASHKLYFDYGTGEQSYRSGQELINLSCIKSGYTPRNFISNIFEGHNHSSEYFKARVNIPLTFIFGN